ncbi:hypothetical protein [Paraburkholderia terrae]
MRLRGAAIRANRPGRPRHGLTHPDNGWRGHFFVFGERTFQRVERDAEFIHSILDPRDQALPRLAVEFCD